MNSRLPLASSIVDYVLTGGNAHVATRTVFDGVDWRSAGRRVKGGPHSLYQLLNHMVFWQDWMLEWLDGGSPPVPKHASNGWPGSTAPPSRAEWLRAVRRFRAGLAKLERAARRPGSLRKERGKNALEMIVGIATHNSYHAGQAATLRQLLGKWPPPSGGVTW